MSKYGDKTKLFYMDMDSFIFHIKPKDAHADLARNV